jgi:hypothetical protein
VKTKSSFAAVVAVAVAIAGCGSSSNKSSSGTVAANTSTAAASTPSVSAFKTAFAADKAVFKAIGADVLATIQSAPKKTNAVLKSEFTSLASRVSQSAAQLRQLNPPAKFKPELDRLTSGFDKVATDMNGLVGAIQANDLTTVRSDAQTLVRDAGVVQSADRALTAALGLPQG